MRASAPSLAAAAAFAAAFTHLSLGQTFDGIGFLPGGKESAASGVSADGATIVGGAYDPTGGTYGDGGYEAVRWTQAGGLEGLGTLPGGEGSWAFGASRDGLVIAGGACEAECLSAQPFRWEYPGPIQGLGYLPGNTYAYGYAISDDGAVIVGFGMDQFYDTYPIRWSADQGIVALERFPGGAAAYAHAASADGSVIGGRGWDDEGREQAARWAADGSIHGLGFLNDPGDEEVSLATAVTPDGSVIVGMAHGAEGRSHVYQGFTWTQAGGMRPLGTTGPHGPLASTCALDVSADASVIVGAWGGPRGTGEGSQAAIWLQGVGWLDLATWLVDEHGLDEVLGWTLREATAISDDGTVIAGWGVSPGLRDQGFVVTLPVWCAPDFNGDGWLDTRDVLAFLNAWNAGDPRADYNGDGAIDTLDVLAYLNAWTTGC